MFHPLFERWFDDCKRNKIGARARDSILIYGIQVEGSAATANYSMAGIIAFGNTNNFKTLINNLNAARQGVLHFNENPAPAVFEPSPLGHITKLNHITGFHNSAFVGEIRGQASKKNCKVCFLAIFGHNAANSKNINQLLLGESFKMFMKPQIHYLCIFFVFGLKNGFRYHFLLLLPVHRGFPANH